MKIGILGSATNGGAIQIVDILQELGTCSTIRIYDDSQQSRHMNVLGCSVVGPIDAVSTDVHRGIIDAIVVAVGSILPRERIFKKAEQLGVNMPNIIAPSALISKSASLGKGNVILPQTYIGPGVAVSDNNYITTASVINHNSTIGSHCYLSAGVTIAGRVRIGDRVRLDTNCIITADADVSDDSLVLAGEVFGPTRGR